MGGLDYSEVNFLKIVNITINNEGEYSNDPRDPGGETKYGISKRSYPHLDIKNLTREEAIEIYRDDFWNKHPFAKIKDFNICQKFFDIAVNMGYTQAAKLLQRAQGDVKVDGIMGTISIGEVNASNPVVLLEKYKEKIKEFYRNLVKKNPVNERFINGWIHRANQ
jgi:lysozyme family protein